MSNMLNRYIRVTCLYNKCLAFKYEKIYPSLFIFSITLSVILAYLCGLYKWGIVFGILCVVINRSLSHLITKPIFDKHERIRRLIYDKLNYKDKSNLIKCLIEKGIIDNNSISKL